MEEIITGISKHIDFIFVKIHFVSRDTQRLFQVERRLVKADFKKKEDKTTAISKQINFKMEQNITGILKHTDFIFCENTLCKKRDTQRLFQVERRLVESRTTGLPRSRPRAEFSQDFSKICSFSVLFLKTWVIRKRITVGSNLKSYLSPTFAKEVIFAKISSSFPYSSFISIRGRSK